MNDGASMRQHGARVRVILWIALVATMVSLNLLFPGNTPWIKDEPKFIRQAFLANRDGVLAKQVLVGNLGVRYFPLPIWLYQLGLLCTDDLVSLVLIKSCLSIGLTILGLALFLHNAGYSRFALLIPLASPFQYIWHRTLWDNGMLIPMSALFVGFLSFYLKQRSTPSLVVTTCIAVIMLYIHPMASPVVLAGAATVFFATWRDLVQNRQRVVAAAIVAAVLLLPYAWRLSSQIGFLTLKKSGTVDPFSYMTAICHLFGYFAYPDFFDCFGLPVDGQGRAWSFVSCIARFTFVAVAAYWAVGVVFAARAANVERKSGDRWTTETALAFFATAGVVLQSVMFLLVNRAAMFHYYNAIWVCVFVLLSRGVTQVERMPHSRWANCVLPMCIVCSIFLHVVTIMCICENGGTRDLKFGPTLASQIRVVKEILWRPPASRSQLSFEIVHYQWYPNAFGTLYQLYREDIRPQPTSQGRIRICYVDDHSGHILVVREE